VSVTVAALLAEPALQLVALTSHCHPGDREISWVATTELSEPAPFLRGGELVCTTALQERTDQQWRTLVDQLVEVPVAALCIGTGLVRDAVPQSLVTAAETAGLAVVNSPVSVPFIQISRLVADRIFAEQYELVRSSAFAQDQLLRDLLDGRGLPHLVRTLARHLGAGAEVALVDGDGRWIAGHSPTPSGAASTGAPQDVAGHEVSGQEADGEPVAEGGEGWGPTSEVPILVDREPLAYLRARAPRPRPDILSSAANVLGLEIARRQAVLRGQRALAAQVLEDIVQRTGSDAESRRRLADLGVTPDEEHRVVIGRAQGAAQALTRHPTAILRLFDDVEENHLTAWHDDRVVLVVSAETDADEVARGLLTRLRDRDPHAAVGVSAAHPGITGLRRGHLEARLAGERGPGVHRSVELSLGAVLLAGADAGTHELADSTLRPLVEHDRDRGSDLVATLRAWLSRDCSMAATCAALHLHRNSLRYRLAQIGELTGQDLDTMAARVDLWLAVHHGQLRSSQPG
jgi:purine catabolism regulator